VNTNGRVARLKRVANGRQQPGDLVFFGAGASNTHHVGVFIGNGKMINALKTGTSIKVDRVSVMADLVGYYRMP
jgi:cell wall-associated NlpC family hydrolase